MAHGQLRSLPLHRTGTQTVNIPNNAVIIGVTTMSNGPALLIESHDPMSTDLQPYSITVLDIGLSEAISAPDNTDFLGVATTGNRAWAVFKSIY